MGVLIYSSLQMLIPVENNNSMESILTCPLCQDSF
jgi:hypothetical protein